MLDRFKADGRCDRETLLELQKALEGKARFVMFVIVTYDEASRGVSEQEDPITKQKTKTASAGRTSTFRLHVYDLTDQRLHWNYQTIGMASSSDTKDATDFLKQNANESVLSSLAKSVVNDALKPDPKTQTVPDLAQTIRKAFNGVGKHLSPSQK